MVAKATSQLLDSPRFLERLGRALVDRSEAHDEPTPGFQFCRFSFFLWELVDELQDGALVTSRFSEPSVLARGAGGPLPQRDRFDGPARSTQVVRGDLGHASARPDATSISPTAPWIRARSDLSTDRLDASWKRPWRNWSSSVFPVASITACS